MVEVPNTHYYNLNLLTKTCWETWPSFQDYIHLKQYTNISILERRNTLNKIGTINKRVINKLGLNIDPTPVYIGDSNVKHMKARHPKDYEKHKNHISLILSKPDYIRINKKDNSLEYVKEFKVGNEYVKVAIRVSSSGKWFVRSMYSLNTNRVNNFIKKGSLIKF